MSEMRRTLAPDWANYAQSIPWRTLLCLIAIGVELAVLVEFAPDTLRAWWRVDSVGDFSKFFRQADGLEQPGLYSPAVSLLIHPLTYLGITNAYRAYVVVQVVALLGVAYLSQRQVEDLEAKVAVALGVLSIPQMHWAVRLGHFTPLIALALMGGLLLLRNRPVLAGVCFALLALKPQYALLPGLYLGFTRNWRALGVMAGGALLLNGAGFLAVGVGEIAPYVSRLFDWSGDASDNLFAAQQSWQYAWQGVLISAGFDPNPLLVFDLLLLSVAVVGLAWLRGSRDAALAAVAFGVLLITPYSNFYDWGLLAVGGVLLLGAEVRGRQLLPVVSFGMYVALIAAQRATPFPPSAELFGADLGEAPRAATNGIYWVTPLTLAVVAFLALGSRLEELQATVARAPRFRTLLGLRREVLAGALLVVPAAYFAMAFASHFAPFELSSSARASSEAVERVPIDFPLPADHHVENAGQGVELAYRVEWSSDEPASEVAGIYRNLLDDSNWELMLDDSAGADYNVRIARFTPYGEMTHWAMLDVVDSPQGSRISLEFASIQALAEAAR